MKKLHQKIKKKVKEKISKEKIKRRKKTILTTLLLFSLFFGIYYWEYNKRVHVTEGIVIEYTDKLMLQDELEEMVAGYPIEQMVPFIVKQDKKVAAFLIAIAKKESAWGRHVPHLNGEDCFNYWGYRGGGDSVTQGGYTCFDSPEEAIEIVGKRIAYLVEDQGLDTPNKMIVWKCGSTCAGHSSYGVQKWISDVNIYFKKIVRTTLIREE